MSTSQSSDNFKYSFLALSLLGFVSCLYRADYNVALGIFGFMLWDQFHFPQKHRVLWVLLISIIGDLAWLIAISAIIWNQQDIANQNLRRLTEIAQILALIYKISLIAYTGCKYEQCSDLISWISFKRKVLYL